MFCRQSVHDQTKGREQIASSLGGRISDLHVWGERARKEPFIQRPLLPSSNTPISSNDEVPSVFLDFDQVFDMSWEWHTLCNVSSTTLHALMTAIYLGILIPSAR